MPASATAKMGDFLYEGHRIAYDSYGEGERVLVLVHGLLMNRRMFERLGPELAAAGNRVICVDLLGHGRSDRPEDLRLYSMPLFARQVVGAARPPRARLGGRSAGPRSAPTSASSWRCATRSALAGLFVEMPVLDNALPAVAGAFTPVLLGLRYGKPVFELASRATSLLPRTNFLLDIGLDWVRQRPGPSGAVLEGLLLGETAPHREQRLGDRAADPDRRPPARPAAPLQRRRACWPRSWPTLAWSRPARSSSGG